MADIFLSYAHKDVSRAKALAGVLERQGWSVWWDYKMRVGNPFDLAITDELKNAKCVVVLWSEESVQSDWVKSEAFAGHRQRKLIPALLDAVEPPLVFQWLNAAELSGWKGELEHTEFQRLLFAIGEVLQHPPKSLRNNSGTAAQPAEAIPVSQSELERARRYFEFFSPDHTPYRTAAPPRVGEVWRLERTLPSGLYLGIKWTKLEEAADLFRYLLRRPGRRFKREEYDFRAFQYDVEKHQREHPLLYADDHWETCSASWHPTEKLLVTAGTGNQAKLWDVTSGELITESPCWSSYSSGRSISWSGDAAVFAVDKYSFDGRTGELLGEAPREISDWTYSSHEYDMLRGPTNYQSGGASHLASTHNFNSFKPGSPHRVIKDRKRNLTLRHRVTGAVERVIDLGVPWEVKDFAWHPGGQFLAVAFEQHNARVVDVDGMRTVDSLSAQHLVGWSPDGKTLVLRGKRGKVTDDFILWDALETKERPAADETKNELWFRRFFDNVSADGLRRLEIEDREGRIYSVATGELVATLPNEVTSAAWSPIDGGLLATCAKSKTHVWSI